jgi:transposase
MSASSNPGDVVPAASPETSSAPLICVGIDVSKDKWDAHILPDNKALSIPADAEGLKKLLKFLPKPGTCLIALEASGGYEADVMCDLQAEGHLVARVNPRQVRDFANGMGQRAKTDALDAKVLALFALKMEPVPSEQVSQQRRELTALVVRRRQLIAMRTMESNRLLQARVKKTRKNVEKTLAFLERQIEEIETAIARLIDHHDEWKPKVELLTSVPGIGPASAASLVSELPELGQANRQEIAMLVGVAPINRDSGTMRGQRSTRGGRKHLRTALFMATVAAMRVNPALRAFSQRLAIAGKSFKMRVIACMRKLLVILNTMLRTNQPWTDKTLVT